MLVRFEPKRRYQHRFISQLETPNVDSLQLGYMEAARAWPCGLVPGLRVSKTQRFVDVPRPRFLLI